jgi:hypothetical protein
MVFYHNPIKYIDIFGHSFRFWNLTFFLAIIVVSILTFLYVRKKGLDKRFFLQLLFLISLGVVIFSWFIPGYLLKETLSSFSGIFIGSLIAILYVKWRKKSYRYLDIIALFLPIGFAIARVGCFFNWCCMGIETILPWGVIVVENHLPVHPTQIYLIIINLILFGVFFYFRNHKFLKNKPGNLSLSIFASYSFFRLFLVEPLRYGIEGSTRSITLSLIFSVTLLVLYIRNRNI